MYFIRNLTPQCGVLCFAFPRGNDAKSKDINPDETLYAIKRQLFYANNLS